jgi:hypothetical protein
MSTYCLEWKRPYYLPGFWWMQQGHSYSLKGAHYVSSNWPRFSLSFISPQSSIDQLIPATAWSANLKTILGLSRGLIFFLPTLLLSPVAFVSDGQLDLSSGD